MALTEKQTLIAIGVGTLVASSVFGYLTYETEQVIESKKAEVGGVRAQISQSRTKIAKVRKLEDDVLILRENLQEYVKILPDDREVITFLRQLSQLAQQIGIHIKQFQPVNMQTRKLFEPVVYKVRAKGTIWQILTYLNQVESQRRFMVVPKIKITPGERNRESEDLDEIVHNVELEIQTFRYNPKKGSSRPTKIIHPDRRLLVLQERIVQERRNINAQEPYYFGGARNRRDPFIDPRIPAITDPNVQGMSIQDQRKVYEELRARVTQLDDDYTRYRERVTKLIERIELHQQIRNAIQALDQEFDKTARSGVFTYLPLRSKFQRERDRYNALKRSFRNVNEESDFSLTLKELQVAYRDMRRLLHAGDLEGVGDRYLSVRDRLAVSSNDSKKRVWVEEIEQLAKKAQVAKEFRSKKMEIRGLGIMPTGAVAIINGRAFAEGELMEDDLFVHAIHQDSVEFLYKGVLIVKKR